MMLTLHQMGDPKRHQANSHCKNQGRRNSMAKASGILLATLCSAATANKGCYWLLRTATRRGSKALRLPASVNRTSGQRRGWRAKASPG